MSRVVPINHAAFGAIAAMTLDLVQQYGEALLVNVDDTSSLRRYVRTEARRRNQRLRSYRTANEPMVLFVVEDDEALTPAARSWRADGDRRISMAMHSPGATLPARPWLLDVEWRV